MTVSKTNLEGCFIVEPKIFEDKRGFFFESYNAELFNSHAGVNINFVQDNESFSIQGVLRGLHFQKGIHAQAKLVRVIQGKILDVVVDIREKSETYGQHTSVILSDANKRQLFVPRGFAHGFVVLSKEAIFSYKCDNYYNKLAESGIRFNDPKLNIDWVLSIDELIISDKDLELPYLNDIHS
jgi:dTDP-4-dehydrorhamnose 3,5-epimerase